MITYTYCNQKGDMLLLQCTMLQINIEYIIKPGSVESGKGCSVIMKMYVTPCTGPYDM